MEHVRWSNEPRLRSPILLCCFAGWNDAGEAATTAGRHLAEAWAARRFAVIDAEEFYDFSTVRPQVRLVDGVTREILWPHAELLATAVPGAPHDIVVLSGIEPQLRWRTFCDQVVEVARRLKVEMAVTLGALLADVPHTRDVPIMGTAADDELIDRFDLQRSRYEGPTGIVGVLHDAFASAGIRSMSLWAAVPGYAQQQASPKAALALLDRLGPVLGSTVPATALAMAAVDYERELNAAVAGDEDLASYVARLERFADAGGTFGDDDDDDDDDDLDERDVEHDDQPTLWSGADDATAVSGDDLVAEVERFLRDQGQDG